MEHYDSFEAYIENEYYNELFNKLGLYIFKNKDRLSLNSYMVPEPCKTELDNFHIKSIYFHDAQGERLLFNATVEADIIIEGRGRKDWEQDSVDCWFSVSFEGILKNGLHSVFITKIDEYSKERFNSEDCLTRHLIPYIYAKDLDKVAEKFLQKYYQRALENPMALPVQEVVNNMRLHIIPAHISEDNHIFGKTFFVDTITEVYDENGNCMSMEVKNGTILVDPNVFFMRNMGSLNNTIIHECVHWDKHRRFFELQRILNKDISSISCQVVEGYKKNDNCSSLNWMEWQANALAPKILMPAKTTRIKINELLIRFHVEFPRETESSIMQMVIIELSNFFQVSVFAAKLRCVDLGFDQAKGAMVYVDNHYIPSFSFKAGILKKNQTFIIDIRSAVIQATFNQDFNKLLNSNEYIYVEAMFCINTEKYVQISETGQCSLTDYARQHVDECCLIFEEQNRINSHYDDSYYRQCFLCRDVDASKFTETKYVDEEDNQDVKKRAAELIKIVDEGARIMEIYRNLPMSFSSTLDKHIARLKKTNEGLEWDSDVSERTIRELRKDEGKKKELTTVLALCIGLHLHPLFSEDLVKKSGCNFYATEEHFFYQFLLRFHYMDSLDLCNQKLREMGYHEWGNGNLQKNKKIS